MPKKEIKGKQIGKKERKQKQKLKQNYKTKIENQRIRQ